MTSNPHGTKHLAARHKRTATLTWAHLTKIPRLCSIKYWPNSSKVLLTPNLSILHQFIHILVKYKSPMKIIKQMEGKTDCRST